nr:MAG TPA: hypothetical protein [Caudoviricetes sp.]
MAVKKFRSITFSNHHPVYGNLSIADLNEFVSGLEPEATVNVVVSTIPSDRGDSDQTTVTLSVEE